MQEAKASYIIEQAQIRRPNLIFQELCINGPFSNLILNQKALIGDTAFACLSLSNSISLPLH